MLLTSNRMGFWRLQLAAKVIGDQELAQKFEESVQTIRRDIMFAASLYI
jgi:superfamily II RNA helicase